jgi:hypothetical protein
VNKSHFLEYKNSIWHWCKSNILCIHTQEILITNILCIHTQEILITNILCIHTQEILITNILLLGDLLDIFHFLFWSFSEIKIWKSFHLFLSHNSTNFLPMYLPTTWLRNIQSNTGKSARRGNLRHPRVSEISLSCTFCRCLILFLTFISSCVLFDSYVLLADDHVNNASYFPFMSIKKVVPYFCVLREGYYVIIWLIVRICVFIKDWKLIYSEWFILKRKSMENWGAVDINCTACICR